MISALFFVLRNLLYVATIFVLPYLYPYSYVTRPYGDGRELTIFVFSLLIGIFAAFFARRHRNIQYLLDSILLILLIIIVTNSGGNDYSFNFTGPLLLLFVGPSMLAFAAESALFELILKPLSERVKK